MGDQAQLWTKPVRIDLFHKRWPINYSFIFMKFSFTSSFNSIFTLKLTHIENNNKSAIVYGKSLRFFFLRKENSKSNNHTEKRTRPRGHNRENQQDLTGFKL